MNKRKHHPQEVAAAKAGISGRSARRIERDATLPSQKPRRSWRTRPDPFADACYVPKKRPGRVAVSSMFDHSIPGFGPTPGARAPMFS